MAENKAKAFEEANILSQVANNMSKPAEIKAELK